MKVVRKGKCGPKSVEKRASDIAIDTVFSGDPRPFEGDPYGSGVFLRCLNGFIRLSYDIGPNKIISAFLFSGSWIVEDYKELNAYLCIEE